MSRHTNLCWLTLGASALAIAVTVGVWWHFDQASEPIEARPMTFVGSSDQLRHTVVVPTLNSPIPEGKSVLWCSSFQLAWSALKNDVAKEPIQLANAQPIVDWLNGANQSEKDVDPAGVFAAAGLAKDAIVERIHAEMARRFPNVPKPEMYVPPDGAVAYAYLSASAKYDYPFFENDEPLLFKDAAGTVTAVRSFGIREKDEYAYDRLRRQVQVLYKTPFELIKQENELPEFVLDLCQTTPYQVVVARVDRKSTLAETLADIRKKTAQQPARNSYLSRLHPRDTLLVPSLSWRVSHRFKELEGKDKQFLNPALRGLYLDTAFQTIQFRLDRYGAELASESQLQVKAGDSHFHVNRPFLVYMKKRDHDHPFLAAWIENAELLARK